MKRSVKTQHLKVFLIVLILINLLLWLILTKQKPIVVGNKIEVAEISAILNSNDQDYRRKEARILAERVGPDKALELLKNSALPFTGDSHLLVHEVGYVIYQRYGKDALLHCKDDFNFGCYHGVIITAASSNKEGLKYIKEMVDRCRGNWTKFAQCAHAVGHGLEAMWDYDLPKSLADCDKLFEGEVSYKNAVIHCHDGVFMENLFGLHDSGVRTSYQRKWLSDSDIYFPCDAVAEKYQQGCWYNQASRIYQMKDGNINMTATACETLKNTDNKRWCFNNLARQITSSTNNNIDKVFELCGETGSSRKADCAIDTAVQYYAQGGRMKAIQICKNPVGSFQNDCFKQIAPMIAVDTIISKSEKESLCGEIGDYKSECLIGVEKQARVN